MWNYNRIIKKILISAARIKFENDSFLFPIWRNSKQKRIIRSLFPRLRGEK